MPGIYSDWKKINEVDGHTIEELIHGMIPLALYLCKKFPSKYIEPSEARGIALLELTRCVNNIDKLSNKDGLAKYVNKCIMGKLKNQCLRHQNRCPIKAYNCSLNRVKLVDPGYNHYFDIDLDETLDYIVNNDFEKNVITMSLDGYTQRDIATKFDVTHQHVSKIRDKLLNKLRVIYAK